MGRRRRVRRGRRHSSWPWAVHATFLVSCAPLVVSCQYFLQLANVRWYLVSPRYSTVGTLSLAPRFDMHASFLLFHCWTSEGMSPRTFLLFLPKTLCSTKFVSSSCQGPHLSLPILDVKVYDTRSVKCENEHAGIATCPTWPATSRSNSLARPI